MAKETIERIREAESRADALEKSALKEGPRRKRSARPELVLQKRKHWRNRRERKHTERPRLSGRKSSFPPKKRFFTCVKRLPRGRKKPSER